MLFSLILGFQTIAFANPARVRALRCRAQLAVATLQKAPVERLVLTRDHAFDGLVSRAMPRLGLADQILLLEIAYEMHAVLIMNPRSVASQSLLLYVTAELVKYLERPAPRTNGDRLLRDVQQRANAITDDLG